MAAFIIDVGDRVALQEHSILDLGGGFRVEGTDLGKVIDISVGMDLVAIEWEQAQFRGWYDVEALSRVVRIVTSKGEAPCLPDEEMHRFASIQDLLTRLGFKEDQEQACLQHPQHGHVVEFDQISGQTIPTFVAKGLREGWLRTYLQEPASSSQAGS